MAALFLVVGQLGPLGAALSVSIAHLIIFITQWIVVLYCCDHIDNIYFKIELDDRVYRWSGIRTVLRVSGPAFWLTIFDIWLWEVLVVLSGRFGAAEQAA